MTAFGLGTAVSGGQVPVSSGKTAYRVIGCTNRAGIDRENHEAEVTVPGLGVVSGVKTRVWTTKKDGVVASNSRHTIAKVVIAQSGLGKVVINGIDSMSRAFHDDKGFHAKTTTDVGSITFAPAGMPAQNLPLPAPGQPVVVPGLATIWVGSHATPHGASGAKAYATTLKIHVDASDTLARVAHTSAKINGGVKHGIFRGHANGTRAQALDGNVTSGPTPNLPMPCQGTGGKIHRNDLASVNLSDQIVVGGLTTSEMGKQTKERSYGYERASIADVNIGGGQLLISGIVARAHVVRKGNHVTSDADGTTIGSITANGEAQAIPDPGQTLEIPGVAKIEAYVVKKRKTGIDVTAVRITLLDGTGAVINRGQAKLNIFNRGL
jgi:hypothetical protein